MLKVEEIYNLLYNLQNGSAAGLPVRMIAKYDYFDSEMIT